MEVPATLMYDEVEQLYNDEVLNTRRELQESSANLEQLAKYCEQSFLTCQDQQTVFDQSKGYVVHSLVNVSHRLTKLSTSLSQLLNTHNGRLENINHQLHCIQQDFENIESYHSKEKVKSLGVTISIQRQHKVVQNKSINKDGKKHIRKPIDLSVLDDIGHGVVVQEEPRPVPLHQSQNINSIVGRDKPGPQREKSRGHPFSSSLKQNGAGPPRGDYSSMGGYGNNGYIPQTNQINPQPIPPLHREQMQPHYQPQMQPHQMQPHPNQHPHLQQMQQHSMPNMMPAYNNPPLETRTLDRNMVALERNFDRALTIDRSIMFDPRMQMVNDRHPMLPGPGIERVSDRSSDRSSDQMSPSVHNQTTFNNWTPQQPEDPRLRGPERPGYDRGPERPGYDRGPERPGYDLGLERPGYDRGPERPGYDRGQERPGYDRSLSHGSHGSVLNDRSVSSDDYATQYPYNRRDSPQLTGVPAQGYPPQQSYSPQQLPPHMMTSQRSITSQNSITSSQGPPLQPPVPYLGQQFHNNKRYGSRGSLDDSSCTSSSPSLQSYKTSNSRNPEYDDGSSQRSTNDSGLGTWAQSDAPQDKMSQPMSDLDTIDSGMDSGDIPSNYIKKVQTIYRYNKTSDDELTLPVGATIYVLQEHSDGWSEGYYNGQYGYFPANFTTVLVDK
ncbi:hypothetical protein ACHWQZ_G009434 [Mnemiopsis leidyi]